MTNWIVSRSFLAAALAAAIGTAGHAEPRVSVTVSANVALAPADLHIVTRVPPNDSNRGLTVAADSGAYFRSTFIELQGAHDAEVQQVWFKSLPAGSYDVTAVLEGHNGVLAKATARVQILSSGGGG